MSLPELMTVQDFLQNFSMGKTTFYREVGAGRLRITKIGRSTRIARADADAWLVEIASRSENARSRGPGNNHGAS